MKRCLIIDDSDIIRKVARNFIEREQYEVEETENAEAAVKVCMQRMPDVILLDWHLPGMSSFEFLTALRFTAGAKRPFILYCTTENDAADLTRAFNAGADAYLMKPFDHQSFAAKFRGIGLAA